MEALMSLDDLPYIKKHNYRDENLSTEQHNKLKFVLTTWILGLMEAENFQRIRVHLIIRSEPNDIDSSEDDD